MIKFETFRAGHLRYINPQAFQQREHHELLVSGCAEEFEKHIALSAWVGTRCVGMAGILPILPHRGVAWLLLSDEASKYMLPIVRKVRKVVELSSYKRIELSVSEHFEAGQQFARLLGAVLETPEPMKHYGADGGSEYMYAILKE